MRTSLYLFLFILLLTACNTPRESGKNAASNRGANQTIQELELTYEGSGRQFKSFAAFSDTGQQKKPIVLVIPEWWGVNDYVKGRVRQLAELGYFAMAVDMYGNGRHTEISDSAAAWAPDYYKNPTLAQENFQAAIIKAKSFPQAAPDKLAVIGYCFGGGMALNMARMGEDLDGVASFHGSLDGMLPPASRGAINGRLLVLNGAADNFVTADEVAAFKKEMDQAGVTYKFIDYPGAKHAFTNPEATAIAARTKLDIAYNEAADKASWKELEIFLKEIFQ